MTFPQNGWYGIGSAGQTTHHPFGWGSIGLPSGTCSTSTSNDDEPSEVVNENVSSTLTLTSEQEDIFLSCRSRWKVAYGKFVVYSEWSDTPPMKNAGHDFLFKTLSDCKKDLEVHGLNVTQAKFDWKKKLGIY